jgi:hypothetical protein
MGRDKPLIYKLGHLIRCHQSAPPILLGMNTFPDFIQLTFRGAMSWTVDHTEKLFYYPIAAMDANPGAYTFATLSLPLFIKMREELR